MIGESWDLPTFWRLTRRLEEGYVLDREQQRAFATLAREWLRVYRALNDKKGTKTIRRWITRLDSKRRQWEKTGYRQAEQNQRQAVASAEKDRLTRLIR